jgi:DNA repair exonuclease SbcCD ATPase subunit
LTRSSLEQLYEELSELRNKVSNFKEKEKKLAEVEAQTVEKEKAIKDQLNRQKLLFEDYETRIKALHISIENYERRQKELLSTVARK